MRKSLVPGALLLATAMLSAPASAVNSARCEIQALDGYNRPAAGVEVTLVLYNVDEQGPNSFASAVGMTDTSGRVTLNVTNTPRTYAACYTTSPAGGYAPYGEELYLSGITAFVNLTGTHRVVPKPNATLDLVNSGTADLFSSGGYDKPVVVAQPFFTDEPTKGRMPASGIWMLYNGDPRLLSGGMLARLFQQGYDVWLVRPRLVADDLDRQAATFAQAVQRAAEHQSYNGKVSVAGFSMGGLVVRIAMAKWAHYFVGPTPPVNLIATLDSPLRGALVSHDLQHALWYTNGDEGKSAHERNLDSCSAQQMLENACHRTLGCSDCLECNDRGWYETFYGGNVFSFCNRYDGPCWAGGAGVQSCSGVGLLNLPNGGWPAGIRKIAASLGKMGERTNVCYGDSTGLDTTGTGADGCPTVDQSEFGLGTEWGYIDIRLSTDREFRYRSLNVSFNSMRPHWIDELTPGSRQPGSVEDVAKDFWGIKVANGHQLLHAGTFIPLYSALDVDPGSGVIPFDEYWTNTYSAFHDALTDRPGTWVNQRDGSSGSLSIVSWLIKNLDQAFSSPPARVCGETTCVPAQGAFISHFTGAGCTGTESYYLPYDGYAYSCRPWDGTGQCGTVRRTVTNVSYKTGGVCYDAWPGGNTLAEFVTVYRGGGGGGGGGTVPVSLSVTKAGTGGGTVLSSPAGINCGGTCVASFPTGSTVTLTASPASGSTFAGWSGGCTGTGACTVAMSSARSVAATFNLSGGSGCGEASCVPAQGAYISHFTGAGCTGTESYYLPYDGYAYACRPWDGGGRCGTIRRTVTNVSYMMGGECHDAWPGGNTLTDFVTVYRGY